MVEGVLIKTKLCPCGHRMLIHNWRNGHNTIRKDRGQASRREVVQARGSGSTHIRRHVQDAAP